MATTRLLPRPRAAQPSRPSRQTEPSRPHTPAQAGFLLWVGIDPDDRSPHAAEIIELAETLGELARELLPTAETFTALSLESSDHPTGPPADLSALRTRLAELEVITHTTWPEHGAHPEPTPVLDVDLTPRVLLDIPGRRVLVDGTEQRMTYKEFELLAHLVTSAGRVVPRAELLRSVWHGDALDAGSRTIDVHVRRLRDKLGLHDAIITVRGAGYRFERTETVRVRASAVGADDHAV